MIKSVITDLRDGHAVQIEKSTRGECVLVTEPYPRVYSGFYSASRTTTGTTVIVSPKLDAGLIITDLIMSQEKAGGAILTVRFNDGTNSVILAAVNTVDAPAFFAIPFVGKIAGWKNAWIEMSTAANAYAYVTIGFYRTFPEHTQSYYEWLADRAG